MKATQTFRRLLLKLIRPLFDFFRVFNLQVWPRSILSPNSIDAVYRNSIESSAKYIESNLSKALLFQSRLDFWKYSISKVSVSDGLFAEFGVSSGKSMTYFSKQIPKEQVIYGFDSFLGLQEDFFGTPFSTGFFSTRAEIPKFSKNVKLEIGWFQDTLPSFLNSNKQDFSFVHIDCDTFESTSYVLQTIASRIVPGTVLVFDEYHGIPNWKNGEFLAWSQFVQKNNFKHHYIAFAPQGAAILVKQ